MKKKMLYILIGFLSIILIVLVVSFLFYKKQMKAAGERIQSETRILETKYGKMEYAVRGHGKPILLIHGAGGGFDQGLWLGEVCLDGDYQFISPSKFGYLNSDIPAEYSAKIQAEQYRILLDYLGIEKVSVIGVSAGGPSSMQFAGDYPERIERLILLSAVSMPPNPNDKDPFFIKIIQTIQKSDFAYWFFTKAFKTQILGLVGIPADDYKKFTAEQKKLANELLDLMHPMSLRHKGTVIDGLIIKDFTIPDSIGVPTLVIHSKNDGLVSHSHAEYAHQNIKCSKLILYENGGHGAIYELKDARKQISIFLNN
ncbi:MAG: alpha/beta hydrolase [Desulfovibrionales bacterium]